jgi:putative membrane protein
MKTTRISPARPLKAAALLLLLAGAPAVFAADSTDHAVTADVAGHPKLSRSDMHFVDKVAQLGLEEIQLSKLAVTQASREEVRQFAEKLVDVHEKANTDLSMLASNKGLVLPTTTKVNVEKWAKKRGKEFDKDYLDAMIDAHKDAVDLLEKNATKADDPEVAAFARTNLPAMQEHLRTAKELKKMVD